MNATLSNDYNTQTNRILGFGPSYTTPWCTTGTDTSSFAHLGIAVPACATDPQGKVKRRIDKVTFYEADEDTSAFELIPSIQAKGYYGARQVEKRPSAPTVPPVVYLKPDPEPCKVAKANPFHSVLTYLAEMGKYTAEVSRAHREMTTGSMKLALISSLTVRPAIDEDRWKARLDEIQTFEHGWDSYDAEPPSKQSISNARIFLAFLRTIAEEPAALNPSAVGGIGFTFRHGKRSVYIEFRNTGNAHAAFMGVGKPRVEKVIQSTDGFRAIMHQAETHLL